MLTRDRLVLVLPEHADALFCLEDTMRSPLDVIRVNHAFCSAMGCSPMEAHRSIVLASPWVFHCLLKTTLRVGTITDYEAARNFSRRYGFFPSTLPPQKDTRCAFCSCILCCDVLSATRSINRPEPPLFILGNCHRELQATPSHPHSSPWSTTENLLTKPPKSEHL